MLSFNNVDHGHLMDLLAIRISDPRMLRLIQRFLRAGVMIDGHFEETDEGVPQGAVLAPPTILLTTAECWID